MMNLLRWVWCHLRHERRWTGITYRVEMFGGERDMRCPICEPERFRTS